MDLHKSLFQKKFGSLGPAKLQMSIEEAKDGDSLTPLQNVTNKRGHLKSEIEIRSWRDFFEKELFLLRDESKFRVYLTEARSDDVPLFVLHHGAGSSALSFAVMAKELQRVFTKDAEEGNGCGVIAFDARGHGATEVVEDSEDFSMDKFVGDQIFVVQEILRELKWRERRNPIFLVGHSLGGSILTNSCDKLAASGIDINGLILLDIVEETAMRSLQNMQIFLSKLPKSFPSLQRAIDWSVEVGSPRSRSSAAISVPALLKRSSQGDYVWVMDLNKTSPFWEGWFKGLSKRFIEAKPAKMLILAGTESLDKDLMIGQMQGKYQLVVFQDSGHFIQEDVPSRTALTILDFWKRNNRRKATITSNWGSTK
jgi:protein phosphatase methylesterase 1